MDPRLILAVVADLERQRDSLDALIIRLRMHYDVAATKPASGRWTDTEDRLVDHMLREGKTHEQIGEVLGRTAAAVAQRVSRRARGES